MLSNRDQKNHEDYRLDDQVGYLLRLANQKHAVIFQNTVSFDLTPTQFSTLIRVHEHGQASQNQLGRLAAMDVATTKGVVDRLKSKGLVKSEADPNDKRRAVISLTEAGQEVIQQLLVDGIKTSVKTMAKLNKSEQKALISLLKKIT